MKQTETLIKYGLHLNDRLSNERTFLAWIRTAISIIAFGFVVIRFLLPEQPAAQPATTTGIPVTYHHALFIGMSFFVIGGAISVLAYTRYSLADKQILTGKVKPSLPLPAVLMFAVLTICALLMLYFLETAFHSD
ncbi:MAG TPA: DUF202 domain-containing protein [Chitinophagaceae bacterium]|nr:DUF202 domain-containing protein [Chitinophagaceae bacterium]